MNDDEARARVPVPLTGEKLDDLSVDELTARIAALHDEIRRLDAAIAAKRAAQSSAHSVFKTASPS